MKTTKNKSKNKQGKMRWCPHVPRAQQYPQSNGCEQEDRQVLQKLEQEGQQIVRALQRVEGLKQRLYQNHIAEKQQRGKRSKSETPKWIDPSEITDLERNVDWLAEIAVHADDALQWIRLCHEDRRNGKASMHTEFDKRRKDFAKIMEEIHRHGCLHLAIQMDWVTMKLLAQEMQKLAQENPGWAVYVTGDHHRRDVYVLTQEQNEAQLRMQWPHKGRHYLEQKTHDPSPEKFWIRRQGPITLHVRRTRASEGDMDVLREVKMQQHRAEKDHNLRISLDTAHMLEYRREMSRVIEAAEVLFPQQERDVQSSPRLLDDRAPPKECSDRKKQRIAEEVRQIDAKKEEMAQRVRTKAAQDIAARQKGKNSKPFVPHF